MNVRIKYTTEFTAGVFWDRRLIMNNYRLILNLTTVSPDGSDHNIALERIKFFIHHQLANSVFVCDRHQSNCQSLSNAGVRITTLPEEPVDQVIGIMLYLKLNAIMENRMVITQSELSSDLGEHIWYLHDEEEVLGPFETAGWWMDCGTEHFNDQLIESDKVLSMPTAISWASVDLAWADDTEQLNSDDEKVVFADFQRDESK